MQVLRDHGLESGVNDDQSLKSFKSYKLTNMIHSSEEVIDFASITRVDKGSLMHLVKVLLAT